MCSGGCSLLFHALEARYARLCAQLDPVKGNVGFASAAAGWSFTLQSYARLYVDVYGSAFDPREFARRLWGDVWFHPDTRTFRRKAPQGVPDVQRSFVQFVLEPLYKIYSQVRGTLCGCVFRVKGLGRRRAALVRAACAGAAV